jgi:hypothetical protein
VATRHRGGRRSPRLRCGGIRGEGEKGSVVTLGRRLRHLPARLPRSRSSQNGKRHPTYKWGTQLDAPPVRVRVELKDKATGRPKVAAVPSKQKLLEEVAKLLPALPGRRQRIVQIAAARQQLEAQRAAAAAGTAKAPSKKEEKKAGKAGKGKK